MLPIGFKKVHRLFHRTEDFEGVGVLPRVCIDIEGAPDFWSGLVGGVEPDADVRGIAFGKHGLLECGGQAFAGRIDGVDHELLVACIAIDKVEGVTGIVPLQCQVADGVIEDYRRWLQTLGRAREEKAEMKAANDGE